MLASVTKVSLSLSHGTLLMVGAARASKARDSTVLVSVKKRYFKRKMSVKAHVRFDFLDENP